MQTMTESSDIRALTSMLLIRRALDENGSLKMKPAGSRTLLTGISVTVCAVLTRHKHGQLAGLDLDVLCRITAVQPYDVAEHHNTASGVRSRMGHLAQCDGEVAELWLDCTVTRIERDADGNIALGSVGCDERAHDEQEQEGRCHGRIE